MGFLSYSLGYYRRELQALAGARPSGESVYRARQLLKMLDDLADEGYTELGERLEAGCADFQAFTRRVLPDMRETVGRYPRASEYLASMLTQVDARRIVVVESGCCGTFPLLLMRLDSRADMRMYTTYPYLTDVYAGRVYTARYEENRLFETMASQEAYFRFAGLRNGQFYVRKCADAATERRALAEIRGMLTKQEEK